MGSSGNNGGLGDSVVGSIVWVRRRNGSWWPGKILGPQELSASHLMSPRSGTPVKLLGREDASVDWYNLEKSKRVKAFRCGEFDDCIEKAEASLGLPAKKREKYARREDAILHALELEKKFFVKKDGRAGTSNSMKENSSDSERKILTTSLGALENGNGKPLQHELYQHGKKVGTSSLRERNIPLHAPKPGGATHSTFQELNAEASQRKKGLQDLGLRAIPVNRMIYASAASDGSNKMTIDGLPCAVPVNDPCYENSSDSDSRVSTGKRKRLLEGLVRECPPKRYCPLQPDVEYGSMNGKEQTGVGVHCSMFLPTGSLDTFTHHAPLGQPEISVSRIEMGNSINHLQHGSFAEESISGSSEETESDSSETHSLEHLVDSGMTHSDAGTHIRLQPSSLDRLEMQCGPESTSGDESDELLLDDRPQFDPHGPNPSNFGVSRWQLKGKRNTRNFSKKPLDRSTHGAYVERKSRLPNQKASSHSLRYYHDDDYSNDDFLEDSFNSHTQGFGKRGYLPSRAAVKRQNCVDQNMIDWDDLTMVRPFRGYWEERGDCFNMNYVGRNGHGILIDVDLKVQANRQGEHVPWVSLMSRLNGMAIIGHPIQIEALEDGSTYTLISMGGVCGNQKVDKNRVPPAWSTARRTANFRVPRPLQSSQFDGVEDADNPYFHQSGKVQSEKSLSSSSFRKGSSTKKTHSLVPRSQVQGIKKPPRKLNPSSNQKTKALSSIGYDQKFSNTRREDDTRYDMDGLIKPMNSGPPAVACIPVKLVFSRLLEAVGRPPSLPTKHGV